MTLDISVEKDLKAGFGLLETAKTCIRSVLSLMSCPYDVYVTLLITDDEAIREINREERGVDSPTDVLSFPYQEFQEPGDFSGFSNCPQAFHPDYGELMLGDIVLSADHCISQAEEFNHSIRREYAFLITHSVLHLCGYDHTGEEDTRIMEELQRKALNNIGITRELPFEQQR